ncbi:MAG: RecX family transcriptional regulator [Saprospiraceae bacterium]|nr:RecX family transcriptional regulator [Saprospiraceae bacterium]
MAKKTISKEAALQKLQAFCAYQERCHSEVMAKLRDFGFYGDVADEIVAQLIEDNFLNEERFAIAYARGKFRMKHWGKIRIRQELKMRQIPDYSIQQAMKAIDTEGGYLEVLEKILKQKAHEIADTDPQKTAKLYAFALRRGFESALIGDVLKKLKLEENES